MDRQEAKTLDEALKSSLEFKKLLADLGLELSKISIRFGETDSTVRLDVKTFGVAPKSEREFPHHCHRYGLLPSDQNREFDFEGTSYLLIGIRPGARKYPLIGKRIPDGKEFSFHLNVATQLIESRPPLAMVK